VDVLIRNYYDYKEEIRTIQEEMELIKIEGGKFTFEAGVDRIQS
jgi:hypothetical protein